MDKAGWEALAIERLEDAEALLAAGRWSAGYHLVGYAVECGLKACILKYVAANPDIIFVNKKYSERCWTHDPDELVKWAGLESALERDIIADPGLGDNWRLVKLWDVESRYQQATRTEAEKLLVAVADQSNGVLRWIKDHW